MEDQGTRKIVRASNLTLRFYKDDGWTKSELDEACTQGGVQCFFPNDPAPYYTLDGKQGSNFNVDKLLEKVKWIQRGSSYQDTLSDREVLRKLNW